LSSLSAFVVSWVMMRLATEMQYVEYPPAAPLTSYVECFWTLRGMLPDAFRQAEPVLPDGCMELIFHRGTPFERQLHDGRVDRQPCGIVAGQMLGPALLIPSNQVEIVAVRFHPGGAHPFFSSPLNEIRSQFLTVEEALGRWGKHLQRRVMDARSSRAAIQVLQDGLTAALRAAPVQHERVHALTTLMIKAHGNVSVKGMALHAGVSERQLEREFNAAVGLSPKSLLRILRFQHVFRAIANNRRWVDVALDCGYYDQSHLIADFRQFAGSAPSAFRLDEFELGRLFLRTARTSC
jgi:AraC-like DNA-binding protein